MRACSPSASASGRIALASISSPRDRAWLGGPFVYPDHIPTMISREERQYLWWLAATVWKDEGHILEMGPWLGGSTACLAEGAGARLVPPKHRLHSVDNFVWRRFMSDRANLPLMPGDSFEQEFRRNVSSYGSFITIQRAWLPDEMVQGDQWAEDVHGDGTRGERFRWHGGSIEIAFVDGAKSWAGFAHLLSEIAPSLTPGSLLVLQDYKYWGSYWVPMMCELLTDDVELVHVLPENTVTFRVTAPLRIKQIGSLPSAGVGVALLERAARRLDVHGDPVGATIVRLSQVRFLAHSGEIEASVRSLQQVSHGREAVPTSPQILAVRDWLESFTEQSVPVRIPHAGTPGKRFRQFVRRTGSRFRASSHRVLMTSQ